MVTSMSTCSDNSKVQFALLKVVNLYLLIYYWVLEQTKITRLQFGVEYSRYSSYSAQPYLRQEQAGFRLGRSCNDQIFTLWQILETVTAGRNPTQLSSTNHCTHLLSEQSVIGTSSLLLLLSRRIQLPSKLSWPDVLLFACHDPQPPLVWYSTRRFADYCARQDKTTHQTEWLTRGKSWKLIRIPDPWNNSQVFFWNFRHCCNIKMQPVR